MAALLASQSCHCLNVESLHEERAVSNISFSSSISVKKLLIADRQLCKIPKTYKVFRFQVEVQQSEAHSKLGSNGRAIKLESTSEVRKKLGLIGVGMVNGSKPIVNGAIVKRAKPLPLMKVMKVRDTEHLPPVEDLEVFLSDESFSWANENYNSWQRTIDIWLSLISLRFRVSLDNAKWAYFGAFTDDKQINRRHKTASWLRERILQLGPTFIKLGQLLSTRSDIFPQEFLDELAKLQDRVPAFSPKKAREIIESELGAPIPILFKEFEDRPIAAASLGQVHRAILHNGEKVAVKVQRPGLKKLFDIDLRNFKLLAECFQINDPFGGPPTDWIAIYQECAKVLYEESDYINEGKNADRFRRDFRNIKWVRIPLIFWDYTASKVLTLEYVPGIKIDQLAKIDAQGHNRARIASRAVEAYLIQILRTGFFHADSHPGNLAIDVDEAIIYYDFGMMGEIKPAIRERLLELFYAVNEKDVKKIMQSLIDLEVLKPTGDMSSVRRSMQFFLDNLLTQTPDQEATFAAIGEDLFAIARDQPFMFPATFAYVVRSFSTLEGVGNALDPDFSFMKIAAPYAQELLYKRQPSGAQIVAGMRKQADEARSDTMSMPYRIQKIEEFVKQLDSGDLKLHVRVLESERAAQKAITLHMATIYTVLGGTLLNVGVTLSNRGNLFFMRLSFSGAGVFLVLFIMSMQKVKKFDRVEKMI